MSARKWWLDVSHRGASVTGVDVGELCAGDVQRDPLCGGSTVETPHVRKNEKRAIAQELEGSFHRARSLSLDRRRIGHGGWGAVVDGA